MTSRSNPDSAWQAEPDVRIDGSPVSPEFAAWRESQGQPADAEPRRKTTTIPPASEKGEAA